MSRTYSWCGRCACLSLFVAGLLTLLAVGDVALGGQKKNNPAKSAQKAGDAQVIKELQATKVLLENANHDYKGHRASAVHHVIHAIHQLQHHKAHPNPASLTAHLSQPAFKEAQAASDAQLQQAMQNLTTIGAQIQTLGNAQHHQHAVKHVKSAIAEIQTALTIK
jgi:hypothetical protein